MLCLVDWKIKEPSMTLNSILFLVGLFHGFCFPVFIFLKSGCILCLSCWELFLVLRLPLSSMALTSFKIVSLSKLMATGPFCYPRNHLQGEAKHYFVFNDLGKAKVLFWIGKEPFNRTFLYNVIEINWDFFYFLYSPKLLSF